MDTFKETIKPFFWVEHENSYSVCLNAYGYLDNVFKVREEEGFEGNGYDWASLADVFLTEKMPELEDLIQFDPEADMFCAYSKDKEKLQKFILGFKAVCENQEHILDLFSRAELD